MKSAKPTNVRLIALIVGVVVLASLAFVIGVNLRNMKSREAYKASEFGLMANGLLLEVYKRRNGSYPAPNYSGPIGAILEVADLEAMSDELAARYPWRNTDGWGNALIYRSSADGNHYLLASGGRGGALDQEYGFSLSKEYRVTDEFAEDIVMINGSLARWRGAWCCNPDYQSYEDEELEERIRRGALGG